MSTIASPQGSRLREWLRIFAIRFFSDSQRRAIKNTLTALRRFPLLLLGIQSQIDDQTAQIERMKSRITLLDSKLNLALHGMPGLGEYKATLTSNSLLANYDVGLGLNELIHSRAGRLFKSKDFENQLGTFLDQDEIFRNFLPSRCLGLGLSPIEPLRIFLEKFSGLRFIQASEVRTKRIELAQSYCEKKGIKLLKTDPLTAVMHLSQEGFDLVVCSEAFLSMAPVEQLVFAEQGVKCLSSRGIFVLILPDFSDPVVASDLYWGNPESFRPYSLTLIRDVLEKLGGKTAVHRFKGTSIIGIVHQKSLV